MFLFQEIIEGYVCACEKSSSMHNCFNRSQAGTHAVPCSANNGPHTWCRTFVAVQVDLVTVDKVTNNLRLLGDCRTVLKCPVYNCVPFSMNDTSVLP